MAGRYNQQGSSAKPNTNASGQMDDAADPNADPQDISPVPTGEAEKRARDAAENSLATERPQQQEQ
jgi:hypothetical protein